MNATIHWSNGRITKVNAYYNESYSSFENRLLETYGHYNVRIMLHVRIGEGFYIK